MTERSLFLGRKERGKKGGKKEGREGGREGGRETYLLHKPHLHMRVEALSYCCS